MPRPTTKATLMDLGHENYQKMWALIDTFDENERIHGKVPFEDRDKNIRDILIHLHHWHLMMLDWYEVGMRGDKPDMPAKGYTWRTIADLNQTIWARYQETDYHEAKRLLDDSFAQVQAIIEQHDDESLFTKKRYPWTGSTSLGSYLVSATSSHYDWAIKKLKKYKKQITS